MRDARKSWAGALLLLSVAAGCGEGGGGFECRIPAGEAPDFAQELGCAADFEALASTPLDASIPGSRSVKTVIDRADDMALYFQNSARYAIHWEFAHERLSGSGLPPVALLGDFNLVEYYSPSRRFLLGAVTHYAEPDVWAYEVAPYDTASAEMVAEAFARIARASWFGRDLRFHPTSAAVERMAADLPGSVPVVRTEELFEGITYQPLNLGVGVGRLRFRLAADLEAEPPDFRDLVVLDTVPHDIGVVAGIITAAFQTPLSHVNVLSQNRGTPNMALAGALDDAALRGLDGRWVELTVEPFAYRIREVTQAEADAWWEAHKPPAVKVPALDLRVTDLRDAADILEGDELGPALAAAIPAFGGKASHFAAFSRMDAAKVPTPRAFAVPVYWYRRFMADNGLDAAVDALVADPAMDADPVYRDEHLRDLRVAITLGTVSPELLEALEAKIDAEFPGLPMRFRSSTNAEDLDGFTGAGLYTSKTGIVGDQNKPVAKALRAVWASLWNARAWSERAYRSIPQDAVGMALLVHPSFPDEEANGVALTANIFDTAGMEPGFYVNVQQGEASVVQPDPGVTSDQLIYYFYYPGLPITFLSHSSLVPAGETVLTPAQTYALGVALDAIHVFFRPLYGSTSDFYAMDVEFKFDAPPGETPTLWIKQARPHPGWGL